MAVAKKKKLPMYRELWAQVLIAIVIGGVMGWLWPEISKEMKPLGDGFIKLIKMVIAPIIFCTMVAGIAHMGDIKSAGRLGIKSLIYFEVATTFALVIGLVIINLVPVGAGMNVDVSTLDPASADAYLSQAHHTEGGTVAFIMNLIPSTFLSALAEGNILQVLVVAILFAWAVLGMGEKGKPILRGVEIVSHALFRIIGIIMTLAPIGAFGAMAFTVGAFGIEVLGNLLLFLLLFYGACLIFVFGALGLALKALTGLSIWKLIIHLKEELLITLGTCSSEAVMPQIMEKLELLGIEKQVVGMVVPTGYSFNLDGSSLYFTMAVVFLAQATNTPLDFEAQLSVLALLLLTSKGAAAVVGSAFIILTSTFASLEVMPIAAVTIILGVDRFMAQGRATTNVVGYGVATLILARWEKAINLKRAKSVLNGEIEVHGETKPDSVVLAAKKH
jgi:aerobic C4-dicarboxylate transport protein